MGSLDGFSEGEAEPLSKRDCFGSLEDGFNGGEAEPLFKRDGFGIRISSFWRRGEGSESGAGSPPFSLVSFCIAGALCCLREEGDF